MHLRERTDPNGAGGLTTGMILLGITGALAIIGTALLTRNTENEGAFLYVLAIWFVLYGAFEVYSRRSRKDP